MGTTLDIEDDVLAAKELARRQGTSAGQMVSQLLRAALNGTGGSPQPPAAQVPGLASFRPFPASGQVVTNDVIDRLAGLGPSRPTPILSPPPWWLNAWQTPAAIPVICWDRLLGPRQITDAYLLALAVHHGGRFVSFDQRINLDAVPVAVAGNLCIIDCE